ncbi:MAG: hypothetical protein OXG13_10295 [Gemmatimonadaceae bacterium]|nr:hypothetical protein [Gemmatimonadaceae bacterium]
MLKRTIGVFLTAVAAAVAVHTVLEPLYHVSGDGQPYSPVWNILDPLMAVAIVLGLVLGYRRKQEAEAQGGEAGVTREYLAANIQLFGLLCVGILFFWSWFNLLMPAFTAPGDDTVSLVWILIDATLPLLLGAMGIHLLRGRE